MEKAPTSKYTYNWVPDTKVIRDAGWLAKCPNSALNGKVVVAAFNLEKALVGDFSLIDRKTLNFVKACFQL